MKILSVNGEQVKVKYIGFTADYNPGEDPGFGGIHNDVWASDDGRKFIHLIVSETWAEYDFEKHGAIVLEEE